jgi:prophage tail gpP-like protein
MTVSDGDLTLTIAGQAYGGWTDIRITRGIERCPSDFEIGLTEKFPGQLQELFITPGQSCTLRLGNDLVITGYIDRFIPSIDAEHHQIRVLGRSICSGLVDCAAICDSMVMNLTNVLRIARNLAEPFGVTVKCSQPDAALPVIPQYCVDVTETPFEAITRYAHYSGMLLYDQPDGSLILASVSSDRAASDLVEGQNVLSASVQYAMDERYSVYEVAMDNIDLFTDAGTAGFIALRVPDPNVPRYRPRIIVADNNNGTAVSKKRAMWECARRAGRSKIVRVTTDSWRDAAGKLWTPNTVARVILPSCKLESGYFTIGEVTYARSEENGTTCALELMGSASYQPEPIQLAPMALEFSNQPPPNQPSTGGAS